MKEDKRIMLLTLGKIMRTQERIEGLAKLEELTEKVKDGKE